MEFETQTWRPFINAGIAYDLSHLDAFPVMFEVQAKNGKPALRYNVNVAFGTHCFTRGVPKDHVYDRSLEYRDGREVRVFDVRRWKLSKALPEIVKTLVGRKCLHGERGNFFTIAATDESGIVVDYDVFFTVSKSLQKGRLNLFLQSAYVGATLSEPRPIRFEIILYNSLHGRSL